MAEVGDYEFQAPGGSSRSGGGRRGPRIPRNVLLIAGGVILLGLGYVIYTSLPSPSTDQGAATTAAPQAAKAAADDIEHIDLPPLDDSDALVRQRIGILSSNPLVAAWLGTKGLIRNFAVVVENISHGMNPSRHLRVLRPAGPFRVMAQGKNLVIDPRSYDRFTPIADAAASIDARMAGRLFQSFKPLLQTAYDELGNQEPVDRAVERAIVGLLEVPAKDGNVRVDQSGEGIGYQYFDPQLEALNSAQKQLLRMGAKNIRVIQAQLRIFAMTIGLHALPLSPGTP